MRPLPVVVVSLFALAACGDDSTAATTTTITTRATPTTVLTTAATTTTVATTAKATTTTAAPTTKAATTKATTTTAATTTTVATSTSAKAGTLYAKVTPPKMPETSAPIPAEGTLPDGVYFASLNGPGSAGALPMQFLQWFGGAGCEAAAKKYGGECNNDYYVLSDPERIVPVDISQAFVSVADEQPGTSYQITPTELSRLVQALATSKQFPSGAGGAPPTYRFVPFNVRVEVKGTKITRVEQVWTP